VFTFDSNSKNYRSSLTLGSKSFYTTQGIQLSEYGKQIYGVLHNIMKGNSEILVICAEEVEEEYKTPEKKAVAVPAAAANRKESAVELTEEESPIQALSLWLEDKPPSIARHFLVSF